MTGSSDGGGGGGESGHDGSGCGADYAAKCAADASLNQGDRPKTKPPLKVKETGPDEDVTCPSQRCA